MRAIASLCLFLVVRTARAHGDHGEPEKGESMQNYAQRHMASEHHIDTFDLRSFFQIHDLNRDGFWDREEIEAIYGVHHVYSQQKSKDDIEHQEKADTVVGKVLKLIDKDGDERISPEEFDAVGLEGLPNFDHLGAEGHHYDVESEFFLHHEEQFHNTPETQTDESYNHPEDIEHFAHHESIERKEAEREAKFQGISVQEVLEQHRDAEARRAAAEHSPPQPDIAIDDIQHPLHPHDDQQPPPQGEDPEPNTPPSAKNLRAPPANPDPLVKYASAAKMTEGQEWGQGDGGYKTPRTPVDRMRKNLPYKYKFRRNWGDF